MSVQRDRVGFGFGVLCALAGVGHATRCGNMRWLYKITAGKARLSLEFRVPGFPDGTYKASDRTSWTAGA